MNKPIEKQLYDSAGAYYLGATILMKPNPSAPADSHLPVQPGITCAVVSLKLYLKCLLALDGKDNDEFYRIAELFHGLTDKSQKALLEKFDEMSNLPLSSGDLLTHLHALDNAFVKWKYIHEEDATSVNIEDLEEMILAAKSTITTVKPDWA